MIRTLKLRVDILPQREICIKVPDDVPTGPAEITIVIASQEHLPGQVGTAGDILQSPLFGLWAGRDDIADSVSYARYLRSLAEQRRHG